MAKLNIESEAHFFAREVVMAFARIGPYGRIFLVLGREGKIFRVFKNRKVSKKWQSIDPKMKIKIVAPVLLGMDMGNIKWA